MNFDNVKKRHRATAIFAAVVVLSVCAYGVVANEYYEEEETNVLAIAPALILAGSLAAEFILGFVAGFLVGHYIFPPGYSGPDIDAIVRGNEAELVSQNIDLGGAFYDNALDNYAQIWTLTNEHWIRQAELVVNALWSPDEDYNPTEVMYLSGILENSSHMLQNSSAQVNEHYRDIGTYLDQWNSKEGYAGNMEMRISLGNSTHFGSKDNWSAAMGSAVPQVVEGSDKVYISGGKLWSSAAVTITSDDGSVPLYAGWNDLDTVGSFGSNVYTLPAGHQFLGEGLLPLPQADAADVYSGMVFTVGSVTKLLHYRGGSVYDGGQQYNSVNIDILPVGAEATTNDITQILATYGNMLDAVMMSMVAASSSASALWNVFDEMGAASAYLTTLMVPNNYADVDMSPVQKTMLTLMGLRQLADYWTNNNGNIKTTDYVMTEGSLSLFMHGDIKTANGQMVAENAIFSPFFYRDTTISEGNNVVNGPALVAVWKTDAPPLSGWDRTASLKEAAILDLYTGDTIYGYEIEYDGQMIQSVDLDVNEIGIIDPNEIIHSVLPMPPKPADDGTVWPLLLVVVGLILLLLGMIVSPLRPLAYLGLILMMVGGVWYVIDSFSVVDMILRIPAESAGVGTVGGSP